MVVGVALQLYCYVGVLPQKHQQPLQLWGRFGQELGFALNKIQIVEQNLLPNNHFFEQRVGGFHVVDERLKECVGLFLVNKIIVDFNHGHRARAGHGVVDGKEVDH